MATKNGPAAPVSLSPQRSIRLKQAKTKRGQARGMVDKGTVVVSAARARVLTFVALRGDRNTVYKDHGGVHQC
jgi:hypothetical protein